MVVKYRVSWIRKDQDMSSGETQWVDESIKNYIMESNGRVMNELVLPESINLTPLKDKCAEDDMR